MKKLLTLSKEAQELRGMLDNGTEISVPLSYFKTETDQYRRWLERAGINPEDARRRALEMTRDPNYWIGLV